MKFQELQVSNFGPYGGVQTFGFSTDEHRPITLIWGHNGAGKTSILTALRLCLHGRDAFGTKLTESEYSERLSDLFHRGAAGTAAEMTVSLQFEYDRLGRRENIRVSRHWRRNANRIDEQLTIDGVKGFADLREEHWSDFVREYLPPDIAGAFLFDAERVQEMVTELSGTGAMTTAIRSLLGLNRVTQLAADLRILQARMTKKLADGRWAEELHKFDQEREKLERRIAEREQQAARLESEIVAMEAVASESEDQLRQHGGAFASARNEYKGELTIASKVDEQEQEHIAQLLNGLAVFAFGGPVVSRLKERLLDEVELSQWFAVQDLLRVHRKHIFDTGKSLGVQRAQVKEVLDLVEGLAESYADSRELVHDITATERTAVLGMIDGLRTEAGALRRALGENRRTRDRIAEIEQLLDRVPEEDAIRPHLERVVDIQRQIGAKTSSLEAVSAELNTTRALLDTVERRRQHAQEQVEALNHSETALGNATKVGAAMQQIEARLGYARAEALAAELIRTVPRLLAKERLVVAATVEPGSFLITFRDESGQTVNPATFSAGEKQLVAIGVLWALRRVSGRDLPVVIDTPLGRLDGVHRERLVEGYFPHVGNQVIILSTDKEIDYRLADRLAPSTGARLIVSYDEETVCSRVLAVEGWPQEYAV